MLPSTEGITDMSNPDVNDPDSPSSLKQMASKVLKSAGLSHPAPPSSQTQMKLEPIKEARENLPSYSEEVEERPSSILSQQSESASHKTGHNTPDIMPGLFLSHLYWIVVINISEILLNQTPLNFFFSLKPILLHYVPSH